jgi:hypothetical protein
MAHENGLIVFALNSECFDPVLSSSITKVKSKNSKNMWSEKKSYC